MGNSPILVVAAFALGTGGCQRDRTHDNPLTGSVDASGSVPGDTAGGTDAGTPSERPPEPIFTLTGIPWNPGEPSGGFALGDVDGDGVGEIALRADAVVARFGAPLSDGGTRGWSTADGTFSGRRVAAVASGGDVDGDGLEDVVLGAPAEYDWDGSDPDHVYLLHGPWRGPRTPADADVVLVGPFSGGYDTGTTWNYSCIVDHLAGAAVSGGGDLDGDGFVDLAVGAPLYCGEDTGAAAFVYVAYGPFAPSGELATSRGRIESPTLQIGTSVAILGDVDGDGLDDLAYGGSRAFLTRGPVGAEDVGDADLELEATLAVSAVGDLTGDGLPDLGATEFSQSYLVPGLSTGAIDIGHAAVASFPIGSYSSLTAGGDLDGDGSDDAVVAGLRQRWHVYTFFGPVQGNLQPSAADWAFDGDWTADALGLGVGNVDGDGRTEILTALYGYETGEAMLFGIGDP